MQLDTTKKTIEPKDVVINQFYIILCGDICPFTGKKSIQTFKAKAINFLNLPNTKYDFCFCYTDSYGLDSYITVENVKILKRVFYFNLNDGRKNKC